MSRLVVLLAVLPLFHGCGAPSRVAPAAPAVPGSQPASGAQAPTRTTANEQFATDLKRVLAAESRFEYATALKDAQQLKQQYGSQAEMQPRIQALLERLEELSSRETKLASAIKDLNDEPRRENARVLLTDAGMLGRALLRRTVASGEPQSAQAAAELLVSLRDEDAPQTLLARCLQKPPHALRAALCDQLRAISDLVSPAMLPELYAAFKKEPDGQRELGALAVMLVRRNSDGARENFNVLLRDAGAYDLLKQANLISEVPREGLALWLRFDEMSGSAAGNSAGLQVPGGTLTGARWTPGRFDGAALCNGKDQWVQVDASKLELGKNNADFSIAFWMCYTPTTNGWRSITHKGAQDRERTFAMWFHADSDRIWYRISTDTNFDEGGCSACVLQPNNWYHIAYVKQDKSLTLYVNGGVDSSVRINGQIQSNPGPIYIGKNPWHHSVEGRYDDYVVYTRALTAEEVKGMAGNVEKPSAIRLSAPEPAPQF